MTEGQKVSFSLPVISYLKISPANERWQIYSKFFVLVISQVLSHETLPHIKVMSSSVATGFKNLALDGLCLYMHIL